jgi:hypothetical protein
MARQDPNKHRAKPRETYEQREHQKTLRRNQIVFAVFSAFIILSMVLSLVRF